MTKPLAIDLCCGLGGWTEGLLAEGYRVIGYDIEAHEYGDEKYPGELRLENVLTLNGAQFKDAALIVASPPCTEFSYMAMPWKRAKQIARALRGQDVFPDGYKGSRTLAELTAIFDACVRIADEASAAAGHRVPLVLENVKGAQPWVGRAKWSFGSYFLWGDVPALMPIKKYHERQKVKAGEQWNIHRENFTGTRGWDEGLKNPGFRFDGSGKSFQSESVNRHVAPSEGSKSRGMNWSNRDLRGQDFTRIAGAQASAAEAIKNTGGSWFNIAHNKASGRANNPVSVPAEARKGPAGGWFGEYTPGEGMQRNTSSKSPARKAASAKIAKIPFALSSWIARTYKPAAERAV